MWVISNVAAVIKKKLDSVLFPVNAWKHVKNLNKRMDEITFSIQRHGWTDKQNR